MHRAFVITLGHALDDAKERLQHEFETRQRLGGLLNQVDAKFLAAPIEGVGNLSKPIELLREKLWEDIIDRLTELLTFQSSAEGFHLDIILITNYGERLAAGATQVIVDAFSEVIPREFATLFPRQGSRSQRRWRILPIAILPARGDAKRSRTEGITDLVAFHDRIQSRHDDVNKDDDFPVERLFIVDGMSAQGVVGLNDLVAQSRHFVRLLLFSGLRTDPRLASIIEVRSHEIGATFGVAAACLDLDSLTAELSDRLLKAAGKNLRKPAQAQIPETQALVTGLALEDEAAFERALISIEQLAPDAIVEYGLGAIGVVIQAYRVLVPWLDQLQDDHNWSQDSPPIKATKSGRNALMGASTAGLSAALFALGYYVIGWTIVASAGVAAVFGTVALAALVGLVLWPNRRPATTRDQTNQTATKESPASKRVETLKDATEHALRQVLNLEAQLERVAENIAAAHILEEELEPEVMLSQFEVNLASEQLLDTLYGLRAADEAGFVRHIVQELGGPVALLVDASLLTEHTLRAAALRVFELSPETLEDDRNVREAVSESIQSLLSRFFDGIPPMLEYKSREQFDPTGTRDEYVNAYLLNNHETAAPEDGRLVRISNSCGPLDAWVLSITTDIHRDAITIFNLE